MELFYHYHSYDGAGSPEGDSAEKQFYFLITMTQANTGLGDTWADGNIISFCWLFGSSSGLKILRWTFVHILYF